MEEGEEKRSPRLRGQTFGFIGTPERFVNPRPHRASSSEQATPEAETVLSLGHRGS